MTMRWTSILPRLPMNFVIIKHPTSANDKREGINLSLLFYLMCSNRSDMPSDIINTTSAKANNNHTGFNSESQYLRS